MIKSFVGRAYSGAKSMLALIGLAAVGGLMILTLQGDGIRRVPGLAGDVFFEPSSVAAGPIQSQAETPVDHEQKAVTESPELHAKRIAKIPAGRMADPSEIVPLTCLLVSPLSSFTTGAIFVVDGGESGKL